MAINPLDYCQECHELLEECLCDDLDDYEAMMAGLDEDYLPYLDVYGSDSWDHRL